MSNPTGFLKNVCNLLSRIAIPNAYSNLQSHYVTREVGNKNIEEQYQQFPLLHLFYYLLLCRMKRKYVHQSKPVREQGRETNRTSLSPNY